MARSRYAEFYRADSWSPVEVTAMSERQYGLVNNSTREAVW